jgi:carbamoyltransferase
MSSNNIPVYTLGIFISEPESSAVLFKDSKMTAAISEENVELTSPNKLIPVGAVNTCLRQAGISMANVYSINVVFRYNKKQTIRSKHMISQPIQFAKDCLSNGVRFLRIHGDQWMTRKMLKKNWGDFGTFFPRVDFVDPSKAGLACAYFTSPMGKANLFYSDRAVGQALGFADNFKITRRSNRPYEISLSKIIDQALDFCGLADQSGMTTFLEWSRMGEASFKDGIIKYVFRPSSTQLYRLNNISAFKKDGFSKWSKHFGQARESDAAVTVRELDFATSLVAVIDEILEKWSRTAADSTGVYRFCFAGNDPYQSFIAQRLEAICRKTQTWSSQESISIQMAMGACLYRWYRLGIEQPKQVPAAQKDSTISYGQGSLEKPHVVG